MLLGHKISDRVAEMRDLPQGIDQRSACRHPDWTGPDDLEIKIGELREITDWEKPVFVKVGATRTYYDVQLAVKAGADVIVVDGMQGGRRRRRTCSSSTSASRRCRPSALAVDALQELGHAPQVQLIVSGGHPDRGRRGQGARARSRCRLDRDRGADRDGRQQPRATRTSTARSGALPATTTTGRRDATRPASRRRTTSSQPASTPSSEAARSRTTCACSRSRRRRSRVPAASHTSKTWSRRTWSRSRSRRPRWPACLSPGRTGSGRERHLTAGTTAPRLARPGPKALRARRDAPARRLRDHDCDDDAEDAERDHPQLEVPAVALRLRELDLLATRHLRPPL